MNSIYDIIHKLAIIDYEEVKAADQTYGSSWKKRGGIGAAMMLARKWDRIENAVEKHAWDIFSAIRANPSSSGIMDDIRDLRRYLLLVEAEMKMQGVLDKPPYVTAIPGDIPLSGGGKTSYFNFTKEEREAQQRNNALRNETRSWNPEPNDGA